MKTPGLPPFHSRKSATSSSARARALLIGLIAAAPSFGATFYWDNLNNSNVAGNRASGQAGNWSTTIEGGSDPATAPNSITDDWYFSANTVTSAQIMGLNGSRSVLGITFASTLSTSIENHINNGSSNTLTIGSGGVVINSGAGAVSLGSNGAARGFMNYRVAADQTWQNNSANLLSVAGAISNVANFAPYTLTLSSTGAGGISVLNAITDTGTLGTVGLVINNTGTGITTLGGANSYTGETQLQAGTLLINNASALAGSTLRFISPSAGTITFGTSVTTASFGGLAGGRDLVLTNTNASPAAVALTVGAGNASTSYSGALSGLGSLSKTGVGTLTLSGASTYAGNTAVNGGTLLLDRSAGAASLPSASALTLGGGTLQLKGASTGTSQQTLGALTVSAASASKIVLDSNGGAGTTLTLANTTPTRGNSGVLLVDVSSSNTSLASGLGLPDGAQSATAPVLGYALVKDAVGTGFATNVGGSLVRYTGAQTLTDTSSDAATNFKIAPTGTSTSGSPALVTADGAALNTLSIDTSGATGPNFLALTGTVTLAQRAVLMSGDKDFIIQGGNLGASGNETILHNVGTGTLTVNSVIATAAAPLSKNGPGTVVLGGLNSYQNAARVNEGVLRLGAAGGAVNGPLGTTGQGTTVLIGGALDLGGFTLGTAEPLSLSGTGVAGSGALFNSGGAATFSGPLSLGASSSIVAGGGDITLSSTSVISGAGFNLTLGGSGTASRINGNLNTAAGGVTKTGGGTWILAGASTYTGTTFVQQGTLELGSGNYAATPLPSTFATGQRVVTLESTAGLVPGQAVSGTGIAAGTTIASVDSATQITLSANTTNVGNGANITYGAYSALGVGGAITFGGGTLKYGAGIATDYSSRIRNSASSIHVDTNGNNVSFATGIDGSNSGGLTKSGAGSLVIAGVNSYTGTTTVQAGSFGGNASVVGSVTVESGATLAPGAGAGAVGTFTVGGDLTLQAGSTLSLDLDAPGASDFIAVSGNLAATGPITINVAGQANFALGSYAIITAGSPVSASGFTLGTFPEGFSGTLVAEGNSLVLQVSDPAIASALDTWRQTNFGINTNTGNAADAADPDADGLANLVEYATGTNPNVANVSSVTVGNTGGVLTLTYTRIADTTLTYTVECSNDLVTWTAVNTTNNPSTGSMNIAGQVTVTDTGAVNPRRFLRLKVSY